MAKMIQPIASTSTKIPITEITKHSFKFTKFDPDKSAYSMEEWLKDVNDVRLKTKIDDYLLILKVGEALIGKAKRFFEGWRPLVRNWVTFENDLLTAFPDQDTWHTKLMRAANMTSADYHSISEYVTEKIQSLERYYAELPWDRVLSPVIGGINSPAVREMIRLHQPTNQKDLMVLLRQYETESDGISPPKRPKLKPVRRFGGKCFICGKTGHKNFQCREAQSGTVTENTKASKPQREHKQGIIKCTFCHRVGHDESKCFKKNGYPKVNCIFTSRCEIMPTAFVPTMNKKHSFNYMVDSGADWSVIHHRVTKAINAHIVPSTQILTGLGKEPLKAVGRCQLYVSLEEITLEIDFIVLPDNIIPGVDALIGWETISRPGIQILVKKYGIDLKSSKEPVLCLQSKRVSDEKSGLDEQQTGRLLQMLDIVRMETSEIVTTGKLKIQLTDDIPVEFRPRRLAYSERAQLKQIIADLLEKEIIRESTSPYDSPIVLVKKKNGSLRLCVDLHLIATGVPRGNGQERIMRTLFNLMRSMLTSKKEAKWTSVLPQIEAVLNETVNLPTGFTPNALMFGKKKRLPAEKVLPEEVAALTLDELQSMHKKA